MKTKDKNKESLTAVAKLLGKRGGDKIKQRGVMYYKVIGVRGAANRWQKEFPLTESDETVQRAG